MVDQQLSEWWDVMKRYDVPNAEKSTTIPTESTQSTSDMMEIVSNRWIKTQRKSNNVEANEERIPGLCPS
ncbi:hypothetical protein L2E82_16852 [Cichorium intybus]|uniref:Uncharacterized protein n=1 Tax=Cichorium intybus TaxID=13427 RepID=A0ACB9F769_CICIN|nr:hypothetical protein L2E82_16852 [Cichorium intybus]